jgi:hypothetical protein
MRNIYGQRELDAQEKKRIFSIIEALSLVEKG